MGSLRIGIALLLLALMGSGLWAGYDLVRFASVSSNSDQKKTLSLEVTKGQSREKIARTLESSGIVSSARKFLWLGRLTRNWSKVKAADYEFNSSMSPLEIFKVLTSGISVAFPVTIAEGDNLYQVAEKFAAKGFGPREKFVSLSKNPSFIRGLNLGVNPPPTLEGYLFPDTYLFPRRATAEEILRKMVSHFKDEWTLEYDAAAKKLGMTQHQVVTLASMVEKETGAQVERPMIASVFHNRLKKKMRLESDPTTIYGIWTRYTGNLTRADLGEVTPYNTYRIAGLPIGPISNPGKEAIRAVLNPAQSEFIFFVSHNDGTHEFTRTYKEHIEAVRRFQLNPNAREGKSWRDLKTHSNSQTRH